MDDQQARSLPRPIQQHPSSSSVPHQGITIGSAPHTGCSSSPYQTVLPDGDHEVSRSFVPGSSFIAGHSVFGRQTTHGPREQHHQQQQQQQALLSRSFRRTSQEQSRALGRQGSLGLCLGQEPGLGLENVVQDQHHETPTRAPHVQDADAASPITSSAVGSTAVDETADGSYQALSGTGAAADGGADAERSTRKEDSTGLSSTAQTDAVYGVINAVVGIPTMISFAAIVYQDAVFKPLLGQLARIAFFSAAVHQLVFTLFSSLPFAVGQPQDVGLIFLSSMATGVAEIGREVGLNSAEIVGTALLTLTVATFVVGLLTSLVARFKLATLVQYVPLPVVGGYLGYVGYFCFAAGIGLGCSTTIDTFSSWSHLFTRDAMIKFLPTMAAALALWICMTRARSPWALPITLAAVPASFHLYLLLTGTTLAEAQDAGWVLKPEGKSTQQFWELYELFNISDWCLDGVYLPALVRQIPKMFGLFFVVTFGSCLDVAAIQADMPFPIDFNNELATVGLSNIIVGLSGSGYTGSYIFSQTIFSMRAGVASAVHGSIIFVLEAIIFFLPFSVVQYLPNFFFGALLTVFGIEIAGDWLFRSYAKVTLAEYILLLATFMAIMQFELEMGVAVGMLLCIIYFTVTYAKANMAAFNVIPSRSAAVRSYLESHLLEALAGRQATVALSGFIFFGSSVLLSDKVVSLAENMIKNISIAVRNREHSIIVLKEQKQFGLPAQQEESQEPQPQKQHARSALTIAMSDAAADNGGYQDLRMSSLIAPFYTGGPMASVSPAGAHFDQHRLALLEKQAPGFVILDFRRVLGCDATSAQTLGSLAMVLRRMGVELIIARVNRKSIRRLLVAHGIISASDAGGFAAVPSVAGGDEEQQPLLQEPADNEQEGFAYCRVFGTLNEAAKYAEDRLLAMAQAAGLLDESLTGLSLQQFFTMHTSQALLTRQVDDVDLITQEVAKHSVERRLGPGHRLFSFGEAPDSFYLILKGVVDIQVKSLSIPAGFRAMPAQLDVFEVEKSFASGQGAVVGITDFVLGRLRSFQADTSSDCVLLEISRPGLEAMVADVPQVATALQSILLRDACLSEIYAYEVLERASMA